MTTELQPLPIEKRQAIETVWRGRAKEQGYRPGSAKYAKFEAEFFVGAAAALYALGYTMPPIWAISIMSGRSIAEETAK